MNGSTASDIANPSDPLAAPNAVSAPVSGKMHAVQRTWEHEGFGATFKLVGKKVVVQKIRKSGMADKAGIKTGDEVLSIGSMPIEVPRDTGQIDQLLKPGDQVEFEIVRRGKEDRVLVSFQQEPPLANAADELGKSSDDAPNDDLHDELSEALNLPASELELRQAETRTSRAPQASMTPPARTRQGIDNTDQWKQMVKAQQRLIEQLQERISQLEAKIE